MVRPLCVEDHLRYWPKCEIEGSDLTEKQKNLAWKVKDVLERICGAECYPGRCSCAEQAARIAKEEYN